MIKPKKNTRDSSDRRGFAAMVWKAENVIDAVFEGMAMALRMTKDERNSVIGVSELAHFFDARLNGAWGRTQIKGDFLTQGLATAWGKKRNGQFVFAKDPKRINDTTRPRLVDLLLMYCNEAEDQACSEKPNGSKFLIPSPALIAVSALTAPDDPATQAYALLGVRTALCRHFGVWPVIAEEKGGCPEGFMPIAESKIVEAIGFLRTFLDHGDNAAAAAPQNQFVSHFLAARGLLHLRFPDKDVALEWLATKEHRSLQKKVERKRGMDSGRKRSEFRYWPEFRLSDRYPRLPEATSFINEILGVPLPIRGADTVFFNGLKFSSNVGLESALAESGGSRTPLADENAQRPTTSLVVGVSGGPGTGKTSFALAMAAALSPLDTQTVYLTFEEDPNDLETKLLTLSQQRLKRLSFSQENEDWFHAHRMPGGGLTDFASSALVTLDAVHRGYLQKMNGGNSDRSLAPPIPLLIVVDSVSALWIDYAHDAASASCMPCPQGVESMAQKRKRLEEFVDKCRSIGAMVVLLSAAGNEFSGILEYLVDVVITLQVENGDNHTQKPLRTFTLSKSRQQMARHGTHVFHLSTENGFRLAPQLPSQIDARHILRHQLWDQDTFLDVLNLRRPEGAVHPSHDKFLRVHTRSQILIHGRGSSGKAGLAMKMALAPRCHKHDGIMADQMPSRVLVMSFLYPDEYYENLRKRIVSLQLKEAAETHLAVTGKPFTAAGPVWTPKPGYLCFAPGFLADEDLYSKLVRKLEEARLEGAPYSVVVIDGLHNLGLQFPGARDSTVLWPIIYGTLVRSNVTIISTFTTLSLSQNQTDERRSFDPLETSDFLLRTHLPLLHAMVQASDYVLELSRARNSDKYDLAVRSAINTEPPRDNLKWDRNNLVFTGRHSLQAQQG